MAPASAPQPGAVRLADQIARVSVLLETFTYRLLELEERFALLEEQQVALQDAAADTVANGEAVERHLAETGERLNRIEDLLAGLVEPAQRQGTRHLAVLSPPPTRPSPEPTHADVESDPFYEEEEQPFMDEAVLDEEAIDGERIA